MSDDDSKELAEFLQRRGHTQEEIDKILGKLDSYDDDVQRQSIFDSIESGGFDLDRVIREALEEE